VSKVANELDVTKRRRWRNGTGRWLEQAESDKGTRGSKSERERNMRGETAKEKQAMKNGKWET
jgi:hypothetical protein